MPSSGVERKAQGAKSALYGVEDTLGPFLGRPTICSEAVTAWAGGAMPLRVCAYLTAEPPPDAYISSVRALVLDGDSVLVVWDIHDQPLLLPGGRREPGEDLLETLAREMLEETGVELGDPVPLGFLHYQHLAPKAPDYRYPYPNFLQMVYLAHASAVHTGMAVQDGYIRRSAFLPVGEVQALPLRESDRVFLEAGLGLI